ncbi:LacI family DNA-binding transcriptional regulator [Arthrobacter sp. ISL-65]|uniref:LacI family DNA-binding transcriptional regulator n=1 Tax=Arthrobacter sp. ISL-65 TaxID=2819112 RepID=UPI001BE50DEF|nr:LacI family DNA-binding transcriptional regulator [Arthrobacter sp. ISL-65]MBT2551444.1 LacI family DNA-binding transcriptional regulator [Arthrobacter sp. ISL-65]
MTQRVTLTDVSRAAGVGIATVSRAMGDHPDVSKATRDRIRTIAQELGYRPSVAARALRRGGFHAISVIVPDNQWAWWELAAHACIETAAAAGYQVLVHPVRGAEGALADAITGLSNVPTEGVIVVSVPDQKSVRDACDRIGIPGVAIDDSSVDIYFPSISAANYAGAREVVEHLVEIGRSRIVFVRPRFSGGDSIWGNSFYLQERERAYRDVLVAAGILIDEKLIIETEYDEAAPGCPELGDLLDRDGSVDAVFCAFDQLAPAVLRELATRDRRVPDEISVAGFDDERAAILVTPQLTTARQPYAEMGRTATELLLQSLSETPPAIRRYEFPTQLIVRASTRTQLS